MGEEFREAASVIDMAMTLTDRFRPPAAEPDHYDRGRVDDDNPVKVVDVAGWPILVNKEDGSSRKWESLVANIPNVLKWVSEQREALQKTAAEREDRQQRRQQQVLPPGYVEVGPGYKPPPGYVAVPVERPGLEQGLPPIPENMPPPITQQPQQQQQEERPAPQRQNWGAPPMPGEGG
jgi:hypothetical protein